jgi:hypothetical protein
MDSIVVQPMVWRNERAIDNVEPLSERDAAVLRDIRDVLRRHQVLDRFGINLLHKHFDISDSEQLVETTNPEMRTLTLRPMPAATCGEMIATSWRFAENDTSQLMPDVKCQAMCVWDKGHRRKHYNSDSVLRD